MEDSLLLEALNSKLYPYYDQLEQEDEKEIQEIKNLRAELEKTLTDEQLKLSDRYKHACVLREEYIQYQMRIRALNYGVRIGMQLQQEFDREDYE